MAEQTPAGNGSTKGALGCLLVGVLLFGGCTAYVAIQGNKEINSANSASSSGSSNNAPAAPASSSPPSAAQMLADLDGDTKPVGDYQAALDALGPKCTQDEMGIAGLGNAGYQDLVKNGVTDETRLSVLQHLSASIPGDLGRTDCAGMISAYLVLREQG